MGGGWSLPHSCTAVQPFCASCVYSFLCALCSSLFYLQMRAQSLGYSQLQGMLVSVIHLCSRGKGNGVGEQPVSL